MARSKRTLELLAVSLLAASSLWAGVRAEWPEHRPLTVVPDGPVETVFEWARDACAKSNVPDAPARAFRNASGDVRVIVSHNDNRALVGPDLGGVRPRCSVLYEGKRSARLSDFDDLSWIGGLHTSDGRVVHALAHTELRGERTPDQCPAGRYSPCLLNTITALVSYDGGQSFQLVEASRPPVVATLPYGFPTDRSGRVGYSNPSNIIEHDGWFYAFIFADAYKAQRRGNCLIRTKNLDDPFSWRAWNGAGFSMEFVDPFRQFVGNPEEHVCAPVAPNLIGRMIGSIAKHRESGKFLAVFGDRRRSHDGRWVEGIFVSTSSDLISWSDPSLVMEAHLLWDKSCSELHAYFYPSLIDPSARTPSFEDVGERGYLYLTRYQLKNCAVTWDRDLIRIPVTIQ